MSVIDEISDERRRQVKKEKWTRKHDDQHTEGELARAAAAYCVSGAGWKRTVAYDALWPRNWSSRWWKPMNPRRDLVRAAALIVAEIERLDRKARGES